MSYLLQTANILLLCFSNSCLTRYNYNVLLEFCYMCKVEAEQNKHRRKYILKKLTLWTLDIIKKRHIQFYSFTNRMFGNITVFLYNEWPNCILIKGMNLTLDFLLHLKKLYLNATKLSKISSLGPNTQHNLI